MKKHYFTTSILIIASFFILNTTSPAYTVFSSGGWDGPGLGSASLTYYFGTLTGDLPAQSDVMDTLERAMGVWASVVDVTFSRVYTKGLDNSIDFNFASFSQQFVGFGNHLAAANGPAWPPYTGVGLWSNPLAGDIFFNDDHTWGVSDLMWVAVHEIGHTLGLDHSSNVNSVMYTYFSGPFDRLYPDDVEGILSLYAPDPNYIPNPGYASTPEPSTMLLLGSGLIGLVGYGRKKFFRK